VINRSADASIGGEYYTQAGLTGQVNFRAKPTHTGYISVSSFFARDIENPDVRERDTIGRSLRVLAYSNFGQYTRGVVDLETESSVSFRQYWGDSFNSIASPDQQIRRLSHHEPTRSQLQLSLHSFGVFPKQSEHCLTENTGLRNVSAVVSVLFCRSSVFPIRRKRFGCFQEGSGDSQSSPWRKIRFQSVTGDAVVQRECI
jgi:hypothetical protein